MHPFAPQNTGWTNQQSLVQQSWAAVDTMSEDRFRKWCFKAGYVAGRGTKKGARDDCASQTDENAGRRLAFKWNPQMDDHVQMADAHRRLWDPLADDSSARRGAHPLWNDGDWLYRDDTLGLCAAGQTSRTLLQLQTPRLTGHARHRCPAQVQIRLRFVRRGSTAPRSHRSHGGHGRQLPRLCGMGVVRPRTLPCSLARSLFPA